MTQNTLKQTEKISRIWLKKLKQNIRSMVNILSYYICLTLLLTILELRKDVEYEADDTLPTCCLAMCLDWCLDKICCREVEEDMVYMPAVRSSI